MGERPKSEMGGGERASGRAGQASILPSRRTAFRPMSRTRMRPAREPSRDERRKRSGDHPAPRTRSGRPLRHREGNEGDRGGKRERR